MQPDCVRLPGALDDPHERLKSVHHLMNNNFQLMMSMSAMTRLKSSQPSNCATALVRMDACIYAMSLVHTQVSRGAELTSIAVGPVIEMLGYHLRSLFPQHDLQLRLDSDGILCMTAPKATILSIVTALLLVDACQRGAESDNKLSLRICIQATCDPLSLTVTDNGSQLPDNIDMADATGLGFKLITGMVSHQLKGTVKVSSKPGHTRVELRLPGTC